MAFPDRSPSRRRLLRSCAVLPVAWLAAAAGAGSAQVPEAAPVCPADDDSMRASVNYVEVSPHGPERDCRNCDFWVAGGEGAACGECTLVSGAIDPRGYCDSWALAAASALSGGASG